MEDILGIDLGGTKLLFHIEHNGQIIEEIKQSGKNYTPEQFRNDCNEFVNKLNFKPIALGVAVPGLVKDNEEIVISGVVTALKGLNAKTLLKDSSIPVYFINDIKGATFYESIKCSSDSTTMVVIIGTGLAAGVIQNGIMLNGYDGFAGEVGFIPVQTESGIEYLQYLCGGGKIIEEAKVDPQTLHKLLNDGDERATSIVNKASYYFGIGLATLINMYNPNNIVFGGSTITYKGYLDNAKKIAEKYALPPSYQCVNYKMVEDNKHEVIFGAMTFAKYKIEHKI